MRVSRIRLALCLALLWPAGAFAADDDAATPVIKATPAFWTVHAPNGTRAYLLGSFHLLPRNVDWQTPQITAAMKASNSFVFEVPLDKDDRKRTALLFGANELLPFSVSLPSMFDSEMRADYRAAVRRFPFGMDSIVYLRPWRAAQVLEQSLVTDSPLYSDEGVDNRVYAMADKRGVTDFRAFETGEFQMHLLMGEVDPKTEMAKLRATLKEVAAKPADSGKPMLDAWLHGDVDGLAHHGGPLDPKMTADRRKAMLDDRNQSWIPKIKAMLKEHRTFFITVGAAHLVGPGGVPNLLRAAGYKVDGPDREPVQSASR